MVSNRRSLGLLTFSTVLISIYGSASSSSEISALCRSLMSHATLAIESLNETYRQLHESGLSEQERAPEVVTLLNRTFFPMMQKFSDQISTRSESDILKDFQGLMDRSPVRRSNYFKPPLGSSWRRAIMPVDAKSALEIQASIDHNSKTAVDLYHLDKNPQALEMDNFVFTETNSTRVSQLGEAHKVLSTVITPVGEYGEEFAERTLRTTQILMKIAEAELKDISKETYQKNSDLLQLEAARSAYASDENAIPEMTPLSSMLEGINSFNQLIGIVLAQKIPGLETGEEALKAFVFNGHGKLGLTTHLTVQLPVGLTGSMALSGLGFKNALEINSEGQLALTADLKSTLQQLMELQINEGMRRSSCPMAALFRGFRGKSEAHTRKAAGLQLLAESYWRVFEALSKAVPKI